MKQRFYLLFTLLVSAWLSASAYDFIVDDIAYKKNSDGTSVTVTFTNPYITPSSNYSGIKGNLIIPEKVTYSGKTYSVTSIGVNAFNGCTGLTSITIPNSVTSIEESAFESCSVLSSITIGSSVTLISDYAFKDCSGLSSITIPESVTSIGRMAFLNCSGLTDVEYNAVNCSGSSSNYAWFSGCPLNTLKIGNEVETIPIYLAYNQKNLTNVTIGNSVTKIFYRAFMNCSGLSTITIPNSVTYIEGYAFSGCSGLSNVTIPNSVTYIGDGVFSGCKISEINISCKDTEDFVNYMQRTDIENKFLSGIKNDALHNIYISGVKQTEISIPSTVTSIGDGAFYGCSSITGELIIPNSVTSIGSSAFRRCNALTGSLKIPNSVTSIGDYAFYGCSSLTSITIPNAVSSIGRNAFMGCSELTDVEYNAVKCSGPSSLDYTWFSDCLFKTLIFGENVETIPTYLAYNQKALTSITIPNSVTSIEKDAFSGCSGLSNVTIPNSVTLIGDVAFYGCRGLSIVDIPESVTSIGRGAFQDCSGLTDVKYNAVKCSGPSSNISAWFKGCPLESLKIGDKVEIIPDYLAYNQQNLTSVTLPNSVTSIGNNAFSGCEGLTGLLTIPNSVTSIGSSAFFNCNGLSGSIKIPESVTNIGTSAFSNCSKLSGVEYNAINISGPSSSSSAWFKGCSLENLIIGENVETIPAYLAYEQIGLTNVTIPNSIIKIGNYAFGGCTSLNEVRVKCDYPPTASSTSFSAETYKNGILYVPKGKYDIYGRKDAWREFANIVEEGGGTSGGTVEGDVNGDGVVDISDVNRVIDIILGL